MENRNIIEKIVALFDQSATVKNVFGEPVRVGEKTVIPVAQIIYGLGGGQGNINHKKNQFPGLDEDKIKDREGLGEGTGGGGAMYVKAKGVYEITPTATRFIPANNTRQLLIAVAIGFVLKRLFFFKKRISNR